MPANVNWGWIRKIPEKLRGFGDWLVRQRTVDADRVASRFLEELQQRQPIGKLDPYVDAFPGWRTEARPSVRQGLVPIEDGWSIHVEGTGRGATINVLSRSEHLKYFTRWTGRDKLGTSSGVQVATRAKTLAFWWQGRGWWPKSAEGGAFTPKSDFVQDSYNAIRKDMSDAELELIRTARIWLLQ